MKTKKIAILVAVLCVLLILCTLAFSLVAIFASTSKQVEGPTTMTYSTNMPSGCTTLIFDYKGSIHHAEKERLSGHCPHRAAAAEARCSYCCRAVDQHAL